MDGASMAIGVDLENLQFRLPTLNRRVDPGRMTALGSFAEPVNSGAETDLWRIRRLLRG